MLKVATLLEREWIATSMDENSYSNFLFPYTIHKVEFVGTNQINYLEASIN